MKAGIWKRIGLIEQDEAPEPQPSASQVKVRVAYCGICGSDRETLAGHGPKFRVAPTIIGHEISGTIVEVGRDVKKYSVGQRIAADYRAYCGKCYYCRNKMEHFCENIKISLGFAEYAVFEEQSPYVLPDSISLEEGALLEPVSVAVHATDTAGIQVGQSVAILGAGPIGLLILQLVIRSGAGKVLVSEPLAMKRRLAEDLGADVVADPTTENLAEIGRRMTEGRGFDVVIEACGNITAARQAPLLVGNCGTVVWVGRYHAGVMVEVEPDLMYNKEVSIRSIKNSPYTFPRSLALLPKLNLRPLISNIVPLKDIGHGFELQKQGNAVKVLVKC